MKKIHLFIILCALSVQTLFSQQITSAPSEAMKMVSETTKRIVLDTCILGAQYRMLGVNNLKQPEVKENNFMLLQIGKRVSRFSDYYRLTVDSLQDLYATQKMSWIESVNKRLPMMKGTIPLNVFKDYPAGKITVTDRIPLGGTYKYTEDKELPVWKLQSGNLTVCGYACKKAIATFRGRNYTAWYAPEIAVNDGPWKFWGLPGLILKVEDDNGHYSFECVALEKDHRIKPIYILDESYTTTTRGKFNQGLKDFHANPSVHLEGMIQGEIPASARKARPYNPIELE